MDYPDDPRFKPYVLEDSYVLGVHVGMNWAVIELDACLSTEHPEPVGKREGEWAEFRPAQLWFKQAEIEYSPSGARPSLDAEDSWDYGHIHRFELRGSDEYLVEGEFGRLNVTARDVFVREFADG